MVSRPFGALHLGSVLRLQPFHSATKSTCNLLFAWSWLGAAVSPIINALISGGLTMRRLITKLVLTTIKLPAPFGSPMVIAQTVESAKSSPGSSIPAVSSRPVMRNMRLAAGALVDRRQRRARDVPSENRNSLEHISARGGRDRSFRDFRPRRWRQCWYRSRWPRC